MVKRLISSQVFPTVSYSLSDYSLLLRVDSLRQGIVNLDDDIIGPNVVDWGQELRMLEEADDVEEVTILINSCGGEVYAALSLYDTIKQVASKKLVKGVVGGIAASAASMIVLQAATLRLASPHSTLMIHEPAQWVGEAQTKGQMEDNKAEIDRIARIVYGIMGVRMGKTIEEVDKLLSRRDIYMGVEKAKEIGLIDEILGVG